MRWPFDRDETGTVILAVLVLSATLLGVRAAGWYADRVARERVGSDLASPELGEAGGKEVNLREFPRPLALALLACWAWGCAADLGTPGSASDDGGAFVRTQREAGRELDDGRGLLLDARDLDALLPGDLLASPPDVAPADVPVNVYAPLPAEGAAWLGTLSDCASFRVVATNVGGVYADRCEGLVLHGVRCVECVGFADGKPLAAECRTTGACVDGDLGPLVCVTDCHAECQRAPRFCGDRRAP